MVSGSLFASEFYNTNCDCIYSALFSVLRLILKVFLWITYTHAIHKLSTEYKGFIMVFSLKVITDNGTVYAVNGSLQRLLMIAASIKSRHIAITMIANTL